MLHYNVKHFLKAKRHTVNYTITKSINWSCSRKDGMSGESASIFYFLFKDYNDHKDLKMS